MNLETATNDPTRPARTDGPCKACEDAAKVCDEIRSGADSLSVDFAAEQCADAIRASCRHAQPAASETPREYASVHDAHCCVRHGCKYGDEDCPVVLGKETGVKCEYCEMDTHDTDKQLIISLETRLRQAEAALKKIVALPIDRSSPTAELAQYEANKHLTNQSK